jgi:predicted NAD/FAD-binding protein
VIGSGVAGLTAAYVLQREADVTLYEADDRLGGHAHTQEVIGAAGATLAVDTGFIVHNQQTYPLLGRLFAELDVATQESEMSMSISCGGCGLEYAGGRGLSGLLPSVPTATNPRYLRMLAEVVRFQHSARALLATAHDDRTLSEFLAGRKFSAYFIAHFMTPLISAVWSCPPQMAGQYPARYLFAFLANHGMLTVRGAPQWRTVVGGSARYVERVAKALTAVHTSTPVRAIARTSTGVSVRDDADVEVRFDGAVIAAHADQALALISAPSTLQKQVLGEIGYSRNPTVLHADTSVLPRTRRAQASWNYFLPACNTIPSAVHVSYNMNRLQRLRTDESYIVTLNGDDAIDPSTVLARMVYEHPMYTPASVAARQRLDELDDGVLAFAGAYHGWGFHEDGCRSGVHAAASLGVDW